ncbi:hypothetical protein H5410_031806 [Solanum commersonii]|uniref:Uncharacterized protein n=1 Tax=Solanum commersonii TaxID=4109 RepID=A0A9J5YMS7_SOLCO|nr:hypothetical protein H5410_031806 [Solanum commersonii]
MGYGYFLTKVFKHLNILVGLGIVRTVKQSFSLNTLVECECIEEKAGPLRKISQLVMEQNQLKHELEEINVLTEGPDTEGAKELRLKNATLQAQNAAPQEKLIKDNDEVNDRLTLVIKSISHQPPSV